MSQAREHYIFFVSLLSITFSILLYRRIKQEIGLSVAPAYKGMVISKHNMESFFNKIGEAPESKIEKKNSMDLLLMNRLYSQAEAIEST